MAISSFLNTDYRYYSRLAVTDVATIIADLATELVASGWTDEDGVGTGPFSSPEEVGDGSLMWLVLTSLAATQLQIQVYDHAGCLINNQTASRLYIDAGGTNISYFTGPRHCFVSAARATPECFGVARLDQYPHIDGEVRSNFVCTQGPRNNAGSLTNYSLAYWFGLQLNATSYSGSYISPASMNVGVTGRLSVDGGKNMCYPLYFADYNNKMRMGCMPQAMLVPSSIAFGTVVTIPIDVGVTGDFVVVGIATADYFRLAVRKA